MWRSVSPTTRRLYQNQTREPWGYADFGGLPAIGGDKDGVKSSFYERKAIMGVFEFKPNDNLHMLLDAYHSDFNEVQTIQRMEYGTAWNNSTTLVNPGPVENGRVQSGTFHNVPFTVIENYNNDRDATIDSIGLNTDVRLQRQLGHGSRPELVEGGARRRASRIHRGQRRGR